MDTSLGEIKKMISGLSVGVTEEKPKDNPVTVSVLEDTPQEEAVPGARNPQRRTKKR